MTDDSDGFGNAFLESKRLDRVAKYVSRGRAFGKLTDDAIRSGWLETMTVMARDPFNRSHRDLNADYEAELQLRGFAPPWESAKEDVSRYLAEMKRIIAQSLADPVEREQIEEGLLADLRFFQERRAKSN